MRQSSIWVAFATVMACHDAERGAIDTGDVGDTVTAEDAAETDTPIDDAATIEADTLGSDTAGPDTSEDAETADATTDAGATDATTTGDTTAADTTTGDTTTGDTTADDTTTGDTTADDTTTGDTTADDTTTDTTAADTTAVDTSDAGSPDTTCAPNPLAPWSRPTYEAGGVVVFSELAWPASPSEAWIELESLMALDVDISGWRIGGDVQVTFPEGTFVPARGRVVVDAASWSGALPPRPRLQLHNNTGRLMDVLPMNEAGPWPIPALGRTLVKRASDAPSARAESWGVSAWPGGTPGAAEDELPRALVGPDTAWRFTTAGADPSGWPSPDPATLSAWATATGPFGAGASAVSATLTLTADNHFAVYVGAADGSTLRFVGRDAISDWTSSEVLALEVAADDHLFVAAWEGLGDLSPQMLIAEVTLPDGSHLSTAADTFEVTLGPTGATPGSDLAAAAPSAAAVAGVVAAADAGERFVTPAVEATKTTSPWGGALAASYVDARFVWYDTFEGGSATNTDDTYALFRSVDPIGGASGTVVAPVRTTTYFDAAFEFAGDPSAVRLVLSARVDDGAVFYLNGHEVHRDNLPSGELAPDTLAPSPVEGRATALRVSLAGDHLVVGENHLAVALHQASDDEGEDLVLDVGLEVRALPTAGDDVERLPRGDVIVNELMYHPIAEAGGGEWIELHNRGAEPIDLADWQLVDAVRHRFPAGTTIAPGAFLVIDDDAFAGSLSNGGERLALLDRCGVVVDAVAWSDGGRWPEVADGGGSSLERTSPWAPSASPESWAGSDERARAAWQTVSYRGVASASAVGPDGQWEELVIGLLDAGELLLDDVHVIEDPDGQAIELVQNPGFDGDSMAHWRALGTHARSRVTRDPDDPDNPVLHLVATGSTEHMHNQLAQTLAGGRRLTNGRTYEIRLRARWLAGSDQLNTRLYFNRLARTTRLGRPAGGGTSGAVNTRAVERVGPSYFGLEHDPLVPRAGEPVTVSIGAFDHDGVEALTLWSVVGEGEATASPMALAEDGRWYTTLPGAEDGAVVQLWVEGSDVEGASSTFPALGSASRALYRVGAPRGATSPFPALHTIRILMTPADDRAFHAPTQVMSNASTRVTVIYDERRAFYDVGVRAKGSERARNQPARLGWSIRFDPDDPLRGAFDTVSLDRSEGVISGQREILMDLVMAHAGQVSAEHNDLAYVVAPRPEHTGPAILQTSRFSNAMLANQFPDGDDGHVFEYELVYYPLTTEDGTAEGLKLPEPDGVVGTSLRDLGDDPEAYRHNFLVKNNRDEDALEVIMPVLQTFGVASQATFVATIGDVVDVDGWLRGAAFMALSGAVDHYGAGAQHNAQIYVRPDGRALLFPHDLDFFGSTTQAVVGNAELARLLGVPGLKRRFYAHLWDILTTTYNDAYMARWRDHLGALLPGQPFSSHHDFLVARAQHVRSGASDSVERAIPPVAFAITNDIDGTMSTPAGPVTIVGDGWVDVAVIRWNGVVADVAWTGDASWSVTRTLTAGTHAVTLEARDTRGAIVGTDAVTVVATP